MPLRTPTRITSVIRSFCKSIAPDSPPVYVPVRAERGARVRNCFFAVSEKVSRSGGELVHGWAIWHWPDVMIQAEFHGIWRRR